MAKCLKIPNSKIDEVIDLLLGFQNLFPSLKLDSVKIS